MPTLLELQRIICDSILVSGDGRAAAYIDDNGCAPAEGLEIYRNTFCSTLVTALRLSYPAVERLVGAEFFEGAAQSFLWNHPPRSAYLNDYGEAFGDFLEHFQPALSLVYLPDVARLEWKVSRALHAPDMQPLDLAELNAISLSDHASVIFEPDPSLGFVHSAYPIDAIWRAVIDEDSDTLPRISLKAGPVWLVVHRGVDGIDVERLAQADWQFTVALCSGRSLGSILQAMPEVDAPVVLASHLSKRRFAGFRFADRRMPNELEDDT